MEKHSSKRKELYYVVMGVEYYFRDEIISGTLDTSLDVTTLHVITTL